jgi:hypothetical protein
LQLWTIGSYASEVPYSEKARVLINAADFEFKIKAALELLHEFLGALFLGCNLREPLRFNHARSFFGLAHFCGSHGPPCVPFRFDAGQTNTFSLDSLGLVHRGLLGIYFRDPLSFLYGIFVGFDISRNGRRAAPHGFVSCVSFGFQTSLLDAVHPLQLHFSLVLCLLFGFFSSLSFGALSAKRRKG